MIDVLVPLERGGKAGLFGGAGVGKTVLLTELHIFHNRPTDGAESLACEQASRLAAMQRAERSVRN